MHWIHKFPGALMKKILLPVIAVIITFHTPYVSAQEKQPAATAPQAAPAEQTADEKPGDRQPTVKDEKSVTGEAQDKSSGQAAPQQEIVKKDLGGAEAFFDIASLNLFNYGIGFAFGFDPLMYGFSGILGYRHLNTFKGFPGVDGGTCAALDLFLDAGATIASLDGESIVAGFASLTVASNILWFKSLANGNFDRTGNGIFIGAKAEASYSKLGFKAGYGPAIGWTMIYYNTEKKKFRTTNIALWFYPPTMTLGISATTNF